MRLPWQKKNDFFTPEEKKRITEAIREAERLTSGEVRIYVESRCSYVNALDRAAELFFQLGMHKTKDRNAVLIYVALKDKQLAIFGDEGIHQKVGDAYWNQEVQTMIRNFNKENYVDGLIEVITDIGNALSRNFPYNNETDKNELPDEMVFGK